MAKHSYTIIKNADGWEVKISPSTHYGCFESIDSNDENYREGGLWFSGKSLIDYDGVFKLPKAVIKIIRSLGYDIGR